MGSTRVDLIRVFEEKLKDIKLEHKRKEAILEMYSYHFIFDLALILFSTKVLGLITRKYRMPQVVGALLAGIILGPAGLNMLKGTAFIENSAEIGVIVLMFCAGMETDIEELKRSGKASLVIALLGVIVPLIGGYLVAYVFNRPNMIYSDATGSIFLQNVFMGITLTATSVSITVETLKEMGKLKSRSGNAILGAAIIDDILGVVALTVISSVADPTVNITVVLGKIVLFFVFALISGYAFYKFFIGWSKSSGKDLHRHVIMAFVYCLAMSYIAEAYFGVADITGAFIAGLVISCTQKNQFMAANFDTLSYLYLSPIFFTSIGLKVELPSMTKEIVIFSVALVIMAMLTKVVGCGMGAKLCGYKNHQCIRIGVGMISRGEVALIVASKGSQLGLIGSNFLGPVVIVVVVTTIITPVLLKLTYKNKPTEHIEGDGFSRNWEELNVLRGHH